MDQGTSGSSAVLPPVSREQAVFETFFIGLSQFAFDKIKDQVEKERDPRKPLQVSTGSTWSAFLTSLSHLATAEKTYFSLSFIAKPKFFNRKDSLRSSYQSIMIELKKVEEILQNSTGGTSRLVEGSLMAELCRHLCHFVQARLELMDFYESVANIAISCSTINYPDLTAIIEEIQLKYSTRFHHPVLDPLKSSFSYEVEVAHSLLQAHCEVSEWKFLPSLLLLQESHTKLASWCHALPSVAAQASKEAATSRSLQKTLFGGTPKKQAEIPFLSQWLARLQASLVAKFTLYFHSILSEQTTAAEMKVLTARNKEDYVAKISAFQRRSDALNISLTLDVRGLDSYRGKGYHFPYDKKETPSGLGAFPAIFSFPADRPADHLPNIISIMLDRAQDLSVADKIVYFFDNRVNITYFLTKIDPRVTLVIIYSNKKMEKDSHVIAFVNEISTALRNTKIFAMLKPGYSGKT